VLRLRGVLALLVTAGSTAAAAPVLVLGDGKVPQYGEALAAVRQALPNAPLVDPGAGDAQAAVAREQPAVILAIGAKAVQIAQSAAPATPVVYCMVLRSGVRPSPLVTGVRLEVAPAHVLGELKRLHPKVTKVGVLYDPHASNAYLREAAPVASALHLSLVAQPVSDPGQVHDALPQLAGRIDALWLLPDPHLFTAPVITEVLERQTESKVAVIGFLDRMTEIGAFASISPDYAATGRLAAKIAGDLAAHPVAAGAPLPAATTSPGAVTINLATARSLGIDVPPAAVSAAKKVFR
jgi:putative ABC transport system substrate-binding protein